MGDELQNQVEAILFASGKKLDVQFIKELTGVDNVRKVKTALNKLKDWYNENNPTLMVTDEGDYWKINIREKYLELIRNLVSETELSKAILETLSVIAWKSPSLQSEIIDIRGAGAYEHITELETAGFVTKEKHGRSFIVKVTNKFFEYFDIEGGEGIREMFKKIKESPSQKKVDEFKEEKLEGINQELTSLESLTDEEIEKKKLGELDVVDVKDSVEELLDADTEKIGSLEIYGEGKSDSFEDLDNEDEELQDETEEEVFDEINLENKNLIKPSENIEDRTKKIVKELLDEENSNPYNTSQGIPEEIVESDIKEDLDDEEIEK